MKYIVCDERKDGTGDIFTQEFDDKNKAIQEAKYQWNHLTREEQKKRMVYALESVNPDEEAPDHLDGNYVWHSKEMEE